MVSLNFTFFVLLAMFLGFLWAMHRFVFRPLLGMMDGREDHIVGDRAAAQATSAEANEVEDLYRARMAEIHGEASHRLVDARRATQEQHLARVEAFRKDADAQLAALRLALREQVRAEVKEIEHLALELSAAITAKLELE